MTSEQTRDILKKVRQIEIRTSRLVTDTLAGQYLGGVRGGVQDSGAGEE